MSQSYTILLAASFVLVLVYTARRCVAFVRSYRSAIPWAHWSSGISSLWILWKRFSSRESQTIHEAHLKHGPVIRLSPDEVSVNCVKGGILTIYAGGFDKHEWYSNLFDNYGVPNMFSTTRSRPHSARKRMISNIYSKSYLQCSAALTASTQALLHSRILPTLSNLAQRTEGVDILPVICACTMDFVTSYIFGLSSSAGFLLDETKRDQFLANYTSRHAYNFYPQEIPRLVTSLKRLGIRLVPRWVDSANAQIEGWTLQMCNGAASKLVTSPKANKQDEPEVYRQLKSAMDKSNPKAASFTDKDRQDQQISIASEVVDHLAAGFDTSAITLNYFIHEISQRPDIQDALRKELRSVKHPVRLPGDEKQDNPPIVSAKDIDALPLLQATIQETLRLRAAIPGPQPRITPPDGCHIGPRGEYYVPGNTRISAQAHSLHRNPDVFPDPEEWRPERWLLSDSNTNTNTSTNTNTNDNVRRESTADQLREMSRWFWAFGSGGRMCVGSNLAMYQIKYIVASIYTGWRTVLVDDDGGFEQRDAYTAPPASGKLVIRLESVLWD